MGGVTNLSDSNATNDRDETIVELRGPSGNSAEVTTEGEIKISSFANVDFQGTVKNVTSTEILASVGVANLSNRKSLVIYNKGNRIVYYGNTGVSGTTGIPIDVGGFMEFEIGDNIDIYLVTVSNDSDVIIQEFS